MIELFFSGLAGWVLGVISKIGYWGIALLMAIESSFIPFPSEIIIPPAAYLAQKGQFNIWLVILAGVFGSLIGALINYYLALLLGRKIVYALANSKIAKICLINQSKIRTAEAYFLKYGKSSTFFGRLVPWVRQLISVPAGFSKMNLAAFSFATGAGAGVWVLVLAGLGYFFGANSEKLEGYYHWISWLAVILFFVFILCLIFRRRTKLQNTNLYQYTKKYKRQN